MSNASTNTLELRALRALDVPLKEVSGICLRHDPDGRMTLVAVGDRRAKLAVARIAGDREGTPNWKTIDLMKVDGSKFPEEDPQIEAVCADGAQHVLLLQEQPPRAEWIDLDAKRVVAKIKLLMEGKDELSQAWSDPTGSGGEGAVLLPNGHLLIAKEKHPAAFIEFGPEGSRPQGLVQGGGLADGARWPIDEGKHRFVALEVWWPDAALQSACADFSDLDIGPDGRLYVLSDKSQSIARLADLVPGESTIVLTKAWRLKDLAGKPEGLSFAETGHAFVALDTKKKANNLVLLGPPIAVRDTGS